MKKIVNAIYSVMNGEQVIDETLRKMLLQETLTGQRRSIYEVPITKREKEILKLVAEGMSSQEIADKLFISIKHKNCGDSSPEPEPET